MAAVPALPRTYFPAPAPSVSNGQTSSAVDSAKLQKALETLFPDLVVHGTRNCLLGMTTSLTRVSSQAHHYFGRLAQVLAFERMMREFMQFTAALSPFPVGFAAANYWSGLFSGTPSPWAHFAAQQQPQAPSPWSYFAPQQQPQAPSPWSYFAAPQPPQTPSPWGYFAAQQPKVPSPWAQFAAPQQPQAPSPWGYFTASQQPQRPSQRSQAQTPSAWGYFAPAQQQASAAAPLFGHAFQPRQPAPSLAPSWPDVAWMLALPAAFVAVAPVANGWLNFGF